MYSSSCEGREGGREGEGERGEGVEKGRGAGGRKKEIEREREKGGFRGCRQTAESGEPHGKVHPKFLLVDVS